MAAKLIYIDRIGIVREKLSDTKYEIIDEENKIVYHVSWSLLLKYDENNIHMHSEISNSNHNERSKSNKSINNKNDNNSLHRNSKTKRMKRAQYRNNDNECIACIMCSKPMKEVMAKNIYGSMKCFCDECECEMKGEQIVYYCDNKLFHHGKKSFEVCIKCVNQWSEWTNINDENNNNEDYKEIKQAASNRINGIPWKQWEITYMIKCYNACPQSTDSAKAIEIACKLSKYTQKFKKQNEPDAPWRTTKAVHCQLSSWKIQQRRKKKLKVKVNRKRREYKSDSDSDFDSGIEWISPSKKKHKC
eukprot:252771_1